MKYTLQSIKDRVLFFVSAATSENAHLVIEKVHKYIDILKEMLLDCSNCKSPMSESCKDCIKVQEMLGWALGKLRRVEKKK